MASTPKWYCRSKEPTKKFDDVYKLGLELRFIMKRILVDVKMDEFNENDLTIRVCEKIIERYWLLKTGAKEAEIEDMRKKIKRDPYNILLIKKYEILMEINDRRFAQLTFILKKTLTDLLRKSSESEKYMTWALQIAQLYNKCGRKNTETTKEAKPETTNEFNPNICSNMYPELMLPFKPIDFSYILQNVSQIRIEQNSLDLLFGLLNIDQHNPWHGGAESNSSSLEIQRVLTMNLASDSEFVHRHSTGPTTPVSQKSQKFSSERHGCEDERKSINTLSTYYSGTDEDKEVKRNLRLKHVEQFLQREKDFIAQLISKANAVCPTVFGSKGSDLEAWAVRGMRQIWSRIGLILDHLILWWIDTPLACYPLSHADAIRNWLLSPSISELPESVSSTLRGVGEILTNFICNNVWDQLFRLTLISSNCAPGTIEKSLKQHRGIVQNDFGTSAGKAWVNVFAHLINLSNSCFPEEQYNISLLPVAEQIPILHRIDHSIHSMRLWVKEQAKLYCSEWKMDNFFRVMEHDVKITLDLFKMLKLPKLTADLNDVLNLVCVALRTKLILEVNINLDKLKRTNAECVETLSSVCRVLSLANFSLCFPGANHWRQTVYDEDVQKSAYVGYVLDQIFLPTVKATKDIVMLKLVLKIICESWLDYIYQKRIRFTPNGALRLLHDFDEVREWILSCSLLDEEKINQLSNHDVLRMCKGVGKILLRKPEDVISITQSPKYSKKSGDASRTAEDTQLPSEMFVSNQKNWLQLRAGNSSFKLFKLCCDDSVL